MGARIRANLIVASMSGTSWKARCDAVPQATSSTLGWSTFTLAAQFWGEQYDFPDAATPVEFSIKVRQIVRQLALTVIDAETRRVLAQPLDRLNAVELVLRGLAVSDESSTLASIRSARQLYDAALRLDPNLVPALGLRSDDLGR